jgi:hypothetical protein
MTSPESPDQIRSIVHEFVVLSGFRNAYVQIIMTPGRPQPLTWTPVRHFHSP